MAVPAAIWAASRPLVGAAVVVLVVLLFVGVAYAGATGTVGPASGQP